MHVTSILFAVGWLSMNGVVAFILARVARETTRKLAAIERTPTSPIRGAPREGIVEIIGRVVVSGDTGTVRAAVSERTSVYARTLVERVRGSSRDKIVEEIETRPFLLDDGSGERACIEIERSAIVEMDPVPLQGDQIARINALLATHGKHDDPKKLVWQEWIIEPGAELYVLGVASSMTAGPEASEYRDRPGERLRVTAPLPASGQEMIVSTFGEAHLLARLRARRTMLRVMVIIPIVVGIGGALFVSSR